MKIAIALRTCAPVYNYWTDEHNRIVDADKTTILLTCLNSLLKSIKTSGHEVVFSIHDDSSPSDVISKMGDLCSKYGVIGDLADSGKFGNFISQYEWVKKQECDYVYCVEDDYLHRECALADMVNMINYLKQFKDGEYGIFPFNCAHRYSQFESLYPSYIVRGPNQYWRSSLHSTHTFFISKKMFDKHDDIMKQQAYTWAKNAALEDTTINKIWRDDVILFTPMESLAYHLADKSQEDILYNWKQLWIENLNETR